METTRNGAQAPGSVAPGLCGSTNVMFDAYCASDGNVALLRSPEELQDMIREKIADSGMTWRTGTLDVWPEHGPSCSTWDSLEESHLRSAVAAVGPSLSAVRGETWPQHLHVQGEGQLCNYSRDNSEAALALVKEIVLALRPELAYVQIIKRGPSRRPIEIGEQYRYTPQDGFVLIRCPQWTMEMAAE